MKDTKDAGAIDMHKRGRGRPASGVSKEEQNRRNVARARAKREAEQNSMLNELSVHASCLLDLGIRINNTEIMFHAAKIILTIDGIELTDETYGKLIDHTRLQVNRFDEQLELEAYMLTDAETS
jgi:hypothetical protein